MNNFFIYAVKISLFSLSVYSSNAQPIIEWQKAYGGTLSETAPQIVRTTDGGYIIGGNSTSSDGDLKLNKGSSDFWIVKIKPNGDTSWTKTIGGTNAEALNSIIQTSDGGYI